jgi:hypothetical protein
MNPLFGGFQQDILLAGEWQLFAYERSLSAQRPPPIPLPDEEITLMCASHPETPVDGLFNLYNYNLAAESYVRTLILRPIRYITALPDRSGLVIAMEEERDGERSGQLWLYQSGPGLIYEGPVDDMPAWRVDGRHSTRQQFVLENGFLQYALVNRTDCNLFHCSLQELPGRPVWSPDGTRLLITGLDSTTSEPTVWYGDGQASDLPQLDAGDLPFWLDNETFGYIELDLEADISEAGVIFQPIIIRRLEQQVPQLIASNESLRKLVPAEVRPDGLFIQGIFPIPDGSGRILIRGLDWSSRLQEPPDGTLFFIAAPQTGEHTWLFQSDKLFWGDITFSPDGRWLAMEGSLQFTLDQTLYLYHPDQNRTLPLYLEPASTYGWLADGQWFWQVQNDLLYLLALDHDYRMLRPLPVSGCRMAAGDSD